MRISSLLQNFKILIRTDSGFKISCASNFTFLEPSLIDFRLLAFNNYPSKLFHYSISPPLHHSITPLLHYSPYNRRASVWISPIPSFQPSITPFSLLLPRFHPFLSNSYRAKIFLFLSIFLPEI